MPKITNEEILKLQHVFGEIHTDHDPFSDGILTALNRLAELEALADRVDYKSEPGRCSITLSHSEDEWGNTKTKHVWEEKS